MSGIDRIAGSLRELLKEREIIARCELLNRTYAIVRETKLTDAEREDLQKMAGSHIAAGIFASMMSGTPIFFDLPKVDTYTQINGRIFHFLHTQRYSKQDFDNAYRKFLISLPELKSMLHQSLVDLLTAFMQNAGYHLIEKKPIEKGSRYLRFDAEGRKVNALVFTSIKSLDMSKLRKEAESMTDSGDGADFVILVPNSESLEPFVQFFREKGADVEEAKVQIWVANMEQGTIDPFIGYTTDMDIYEQFKNPRLAEMVRSNWGAKQ